MVFLAALHKTCSKCFIVDVNTTVQLMTLQWAFIYSKLTIETLEQGVKYVQS